MKKIPFNLQDWLSDKSQKVVNSKGKEVRIICWDREGKWPIIGLTENRLIQQYDENGVIIHFGGEKWEPDLFLVTDEPELTEFEEAVYGLLEEVRSFDEPFSCDELVEYAKKEAQKLLTIARKQIEAEKQRKPSPALTKIVENLTPEKLEKAKKEMEEEVTPVFFDDLEREIRDWWLNGWKTCTDYSSFKCTIEHFYNLGKSEALKEQKPAEPKAYLDLSMDAIEACMLRYLQSAANRKNDCEVIEDTREYKKQLVDLIQKPDEVETPDNLDLEKEIDKTVEECTDGYKPFDWNKFAKHFYELGKKDMKEQMMKDAVEADVNIYEDLTAGKSWTEFVVEMPINKLGDKVRIIIVKEESK